MYVSGDDRTEEAAARAAGLGPAIGLARDLAPGLDLPPERPPAGRRLRGRVGRRPRDRGPGAGRAGCSASTTRSTTRRFRGRPGARLTDRVLRRTLGLSLAELDAAVA